MKARIVQPECAELCRGCPNSCKQPAWMEVLRCPKIGYEHPDYEKIMAQARENDEIEHYIPEGKEPEKLWTNSQKTRVITAMSADIAVITPLTRTSAFY